MKPALSVRGLAICAGALSRRRVCALAAAALPDGGEVSVCFLAADKMREMNLRHRGKDSATDVLSFAYHPAGAPVLGDIAICPEIARPEARRRGRNFPDHLAHLVVHGALHLAGRTHDSSTEAAVMEKIESEILAQFGIADPYEPAPGNSNANLSLSANPNASAHESRR